MLDTLREILASFQHEHTYEITTAQAVLQRERFDLILLDKVMPGIGNTMLRRQGLDLLKLIRDLGVNAAVMMMSGDRDSRKEPDALTQGAFGYLHKPFDLRELDRVVAPRYHVRDCLRRPSPNTRPRRSPSGQHRHDDHDSADPDHAP